VYDFLLVFCR